MNIIAYFDIDCIKFYSENNNSISLINNIPLFFYFDTEKKQLKNSYKFKTFVLENKKYFFNGIFNKINNSNQFEIDGFKIDILNTISVFFQNTIKNNPSDNIYLCFSDLFEDSLKSKIANYLDTIFNINVIENFSVLAAKNFIIKNQIFNEINDIYVLYNSSDKLNICKLSFNTSALSIIDKKNIENISYNPLYFELSKKIVEDIYRIYNFSDKSKLKEDIEFIYYRLIQKELNIFNQPKNSMVFSTRLKNNNERFVVRINIEEVKLFAKNYAKLFLGSVKQNIENINTGRFVFAGNYFDNELIFNETKINFSNIYKISDTELFSTFKSEITKQTDEYSTMFMTAEDLNQTNQQENNQPEIENKTQENIPEELSKLIVNNLQIGNRVKLSNFDSKPGKGWAYQFFEYIGDNRFVVIDSTRSLKPGDIVETKDQFWLPKTQIFLEVFRGGKPYGKFQTREIQKIELFK